LKLVTSFSFNFTFEVAEFFKGLAFDFQEVSSTLARKIVNKK